MEQTNGRAEKRWLNVLFEYIRRTLNAIGPIKFGEEWSEWM